MVQAENGVRRACFEYLGMTGWHVSVVTNRAVRLESGGWAWHGTRGMPDLLGMRGGVGLAVECKAGSGRQSAEQKVWQAGWEGHGGVYVVARSAMDLKQQLEARGLGGR
jgi:hypothetical protein